MKILKCSNKLNINEGELFKYIFPFLLIIGFFSSTLKMNNYIKVIFCLIILLLYIWNEFFYIKTPILEFNVEELLNDYMRNLEQADKKYNNKYIKLKCKFLDTHFVGNNMVFITLGENEKYFVEGKIILPSNKCIKYLKKYERDNLVVYGEVIRDQTTFLVTIFYIEM